METVAEGLDPSFDDIFKQIESTTDTLCYSCEQMDNHRNNPTKIDKQKKKMQKLPEQSMNLSVKPTPASQLSLLFDHVSESIQNVSAETMLLVNAVRV